MTPEQRADKAKATLDNSFIKEAINDIRTACINNIRNSSHDQSDLRDDMYYMLRSVDCFERVLEKHIKTGQVEQINDIAIKRMIR